MVPLARNQLSPGLSRRLLLSFAGQDPAQFRGCLSPEKEEFSVTGSYFSSNLRAAENSSFNSYFSS